MTPHLHSLLAEAAPAAGPTPPPSGGTTTTGAPGDAPAAPAESPGGSIMSFLPFLLMMAAVMYFLMIRPQQKKEKELKEMVNRLKKNDKVWLQSGIYGVVVQVRDKDVIVKIDEKNDVRIRVLKSAILGAEGKPNEADTKSVEAPAADDEKAADKTEAAK
ncbi:MAG: preprotein translocase subunit YajC [Planctomycetes bacterium]|nr:preprotein translocase subunit YajC [Planctomycetota bacterium]